MSENLRIYNNVKNVPDTALKLIQAGRLKGKSDINPMWRIKTLTEQFGVCGFGWKYEITDKRLENGANSEISAFVDINLYIQIDREWSAAIPGTGGSSFVANERNGLYTSDECFKMALTDAISVACKALGIGANVYWDKDITKYASKSEDNKITENQVKRLHTIANGNTKLAKEILLKYGYASSTNISKYDYEHICKEIEDEVKKVNLQQDLHICQEQ